MQTTFGGLTEPIEASHQAVRAPAAPGLQEVLSGGARG